VVGTLDKQVVVGHGLTIAERGQRIAVRIKQGKIKIAGTGSVDALLVLKPVYLTCISMQAFCLRVWLPASVIFRRSLLVLPIGGFLTSWSGMAEPLLRLWIFQLYNLKFENQ
jgi:hypothetical protein